MVSLFFLPPTLAKLGAICLFLFWSTPLSASSPLIHNFSSSPSQLCRMPHYLPFLFFLHSLAIPAPFYLFILTIPMSPLNLKEETPPAHRGLSLMSLFPRASGLQHQEEQLDLEVSFGLRALSARHVPAIIFKLVGFVATYILGTVNHPWIILM